MGDSPHRRVRESLFSIVGAVWGFAMAVCLVPLWKTPAPSDQSPGFMTAHGLAAGGPFRAVLAVMILPLAGAIAARAASRLFDSFPRWALVGIILSPLTALWRAIFAPSVLFSLICPATVIGICWLMRRFDPGFTHFDAALVPATIAVHFALLDLLLWWKWFDVLLLSATLVVAFRIALAALPLHSRIPASMAFSFAPLGFLLQTTSLSPERRHLGWPALAAELLLPLLVRVLVPDTSRGRRVLRTTVALLIYPLAIFAYPQTYSIATAENLPRVNMFEHGHSLLPASEMLRGEKPYVDIVPVHGLLEDGLLDYMALRVSGTTIGDALSLREIISALNGCAIYAVALAATGSPEAALLTVFLSSAVSPAGTWWIRAIPALFALAFIVAAARRRLPRLFAAAAACVALALITSLEMAFYSAIVLLIAVARFGSTRQSRLAAVKWMAIGGGAASLVIAVPMAIAGILVAFVRVTLTEVVPAVGAYTLGFFTFPLELREALNIPDLLAAAWYRSTFLYVVWVLVLITTASLFSRAPLTIRRRTEPLLLIGLWMVLCAISYGERHHFYFQFALAPFIVAAIVLMWRKRRLLARSGAIALAFYVIIMARPNTHLSTISMLRRTNGPLEAGITDFWELPRARFALFHTREVEHIRRVRDFLGSRLNPDETFFDFANTPILYFLLDRPSPIRQYEVPLYQSEKLQKEVIARLRRDPKVTAALIRFPASMDVIDSVPNSARAPLVWQFLEANFVPDYDEAGVVIWTRKSPAPPR